MSGVTQKRAALELHNLSEADREWVLGRLAPAQQAQMKPLLAELDAMNVRFDIDADTDADDDPRGAAIVSPPPAAAPSSSTRSLLRDADPAEIVRVLSDEPAWFVNAVLSLESWPWGDAVRHALQHKNSVRAVSAPRKGAVVPPALAESLLALIAERLPVASQPPANGHRNGHRHGFTGFAIWDRVWPKVKQWVS